MQLFQEKTKRIYSEYTLYYVIELLPSGDKNKFRIIEAYEDIDKAKKLYECLEELNNLFTLYGIISSEDFRKHNITDKSDWNNFPEFRIEDKLVKIEEVKK